MPLPAIMTAANTVSRASPAFSGPPAIMRETMSATSMTVTATASTSVPKGSPILWAMTSAWWTAPKTAPMRAAAARTCTGTLGFQSASPRTTSAERGTIQVEGGLVAFMGPERI